jgi:general secretion pathway protein A
MVINLFFILEHPLKKEIVDLVLEKKQKVVLIVDEASLMRLEVFAELHTLCQFEKDAKPWLPIILVGQTSLADKLTFRSSQPLASRVIAKCHLEVANIDGMGTSLRQHLAIAGIEEIFSIHRPLSLFIRVAEVCSEKQTIWQGEDLSPRQHKNQR